MIKLITEFPVECKICGELCKVPETLTKHLKKEHLFDPKDYTVQYLLNGELPKCKCGCGKNVKLHNYGHNEYCVGHTGGGFWQLMYDKESEEYKNITSKISKTVTEYFKEHPVIISDEQKKKLSENRKKWLLDNPEKAQEQANKMTETKRRQSKDGTLSKNHWMKKLTESELNEKLIDIGNRISKAKREKFDSGEEIIWNKGLTADTDDRILKWSGENNYRYNPNKNISYTRKFRNKEYRKQILNDQDGVCFECKKDDGRQLCLHHIDENKQNDSYENLIFLCRSCHIRIHSSKIYADQFLSKIMKFKQNLLEKQNGGIPLESEYSY